MMGSIDRIVSAQRAFGAGYFGMGGMHVLMLSSTGWFTHEVGHG